MNTANKLILWLALIFACFLPVSALTLTTPENRIWEIFSIGYDAPTTEASDLESLTETFTSDYDTAPIHRAITEEIPTEANRALFGQNAEFKAADTATIDVKVLDFSTVSNKAVFYSGPGNRARALAFADKIGATPIDLTPGGQHLNSLNLYDKLSASEADATWAQASQQYASGASGKINLFVNGARPDRVFNTIERPLIEANPNIYQQTLHY